MRPALLAALLMLCACRLYQPELRDCAVRCGPDDLCPRDTFCEGGFCRLPGATVACECVPGETQACPAANACAVAPRVCTERGEWGPCVSPTPSRELCNGLDDDCDGVVDDDVADALPCPLRLGVCEGAREGCASGVRVACVTASYGPRYEPGEVSCDGADNDCDGVIDGRAWVAHGQGRAAWLLRASPGLVLVAGVEEGLAVTALREDLSAMAAPALVAGPYTHVALRGGELVFGGIADGGMRLRGAGEVFVPTAGPVTALALGGEAVAFSAAGEVFLARWLADGGVSAPRALGADDGGPVALPATGEVLAWSGGLLRVADEVELRVGGAGLVALAASDAGVVAGVRHVAGLVELLPDVLLGAAPVTLTAGAAPIPVAVAFGPRAPVVVFSDGVDTWLQRGPLRQRLGGPSDAVALAPGPGELVTLARAADGGVSAGATCPP